MGELLMMIIWIAVMFGVMWLLLMRPQIGRASCRERV